MSAHSGNGYLRKGSRANPKDFDGNCFEESENLETRDEKLFDQTSQLTRANDKSCIIGKVFLANSRSNTGVLHVGVVYVISLSK
jgi:hypothetical protein